MGITRGPSASRERSTWEGESGGGTGLDGDAGGVSSSTTGKPFRFFLYCLTQRLIFGTNWFGVLLLQALLHGATSWLLYRTGERLGNRSAGFVAAVMHAFYPFLFLHTLSIIDSTAFIFCVVLVIWSLLGCWNDGERSDFIWLGIGGGIALLTRGAFVALGPPFAAMFVAALWRHR